jgi:NTE family protein
MAILRFPKPKRPPPHTVFVLGGGGNLGALQVGMLQAAIDRDIVPDEIVGCSVGAINAAALAADATPAGIDRIKAIWTTVGEEIVAPVSKFDGVRLLTSRGTSLQPNGALRRLLADTLPHHRFEDFPIPFHVVATSLTTQTERWFSQGDVIDPILASAALPAIFPPVTIDGELLVDGGVLNNVPLSKAHELGASRIYVFHVGNFDRPRPAPKRPVDVLLHAFSISRSYRFKSETSVPPPPGVEIVVVPSVDPGRLRYNDFGRSPELIERGRAAAAAYFDTVAVAATQ